MKLKLLKLTAILLLGMVSQLGCQFTLYTSREKITPTYAGLEPGFNAAIENYSLGAHVGDSTGGNGNVFIPMGGITGDPAAEIAKMLLGLEGFVPAAENLGLSLTGETGTAEVVSSSLDRMTHTVEKEKTWFNLTTKDK